MANTTIAAGEMENKIWPHQCPAHAGPVGDGNIHVFDTGHTGIDQMHRLAPHGGLQAVGKMTGHFAVDADRLLAAAIIEIERPINGSSIGLRAADHLDQRHQVGRIEGVADDVALRPFAANLQIADHQAGRA